MNYLQIRAFALGTPRTGSLNQVIGALTSISDLFGQPYDEQNSFLLPEGCQTPTDMSATIVPLNFESYESFKNYMYGLLDNYLKKAIFPPKIFVTPYDMTEKTSAAVNADLICRAVKEYYHEKHLGFVLTAVINGRIYKYKYVDLVNVPKHLLTLRSRIKLLQDKSLRKKALFTVGTINNFKRSTVTEKFAALLEKLSALKDDAETGGFISKFERFKNASKHVVFCLGGRVEGTEIIFDVGYARHLYQQAERLVKAGFSVIFCNGPRLLMMFRIFCMRRP